MGKRGPKHTFESYPEYLQKAINEKIQKGITYEKIAEYINSLNEVESGDLKGTSIGGVHRYASKFNERLEKSKRIREQVTAIIKETGDKPDTEMVDVANKIAIEMVVERLLEADINSLKGESLLDVFDAVAKLQRSAVGTEKLKLQYNKFKTELEDKKQQAFNEFKNTIYNELEEDYPKVYKMLLDIANETFEKIKISE